jgi:hypothetical protein
MNKQMMLLHAKFPDDFATLEMLKLSDIPCICKIGKGGFRVDFLDPLPVVEGEVVGFDIRKINQRAPAGGGGEYLHYSVALITLRPAGDSIFSIESLSFFKRLSPGWFPILKNGEWAPVLGNSMVDGDDPSTDGTQMRSGKSGRKRQTLLDALKDLDEQD